MEKNSIFILLIIMGLFIISQPVLAQQDQSLSLTLQEATELALENSFDIQLVKYDAWIARTKKNVSESIYDTVFDAEIKYQNNQRKQSSTLFGTKVLDNDYNIGLNQKFPSGTEVSVDLENNRSWTNSSFSSSPLTHDSNLGVSVTQELGKNFLGMQDRGDVKITLIDIENAEYTTMGKITESIARVQKAYWDLVLQQERVAIEEEMVAQAKKLYDLHTEKLLDGLVEKPEVIASEANYKKRLSDLHLMKNDLKTKQNMLKLLLNIDDKIQTVIAGDEFLLDQADKDFAEALKVAYEYRSDYKRLKNEIKAKDIRLSMKKNNLWPEINLTASFERNGLGDHFKHAVMQITEEDNPNLSAGLTISIPLNNREARGELSAAKLEVAKILLSVKLLEREIAVAINDQVRDCNIYREQAQNNIEIEELQDEKLKEEEKRYNSGRSNTDTLIRFQEDLIEAKLNAVESKHRYHTAAVDLEAKKGILLKPYWDGKF